MKKIIFSLAVLSVITLTDKAAYSISITKQDFVTLPDGGGKKNALSVGSNRVSGDIQLRFTATKTGEAAITIIKESGEIVLQQTNQVTTSINSIPLRNASGLAEGTYTVRLVSNNKTYTTSFLIWK